MHMGLCRRRLGVAMMTPVQWANNHCEAKAVEEGCLVW